MEVVALSITSEAFSIDSGLTGLPPMAWPPLSEGCQVGIPWLDDTRRQRYLSAPEQQDLFETATTTLEVSYRLNR
jgi:hypothetical protein